MRTMNLDGVDTQARRSFSRRDERSAHAIEASDVKLQRRRLTLFVRQRGWRMRHPPAPGDRDQLTALPRYAAGPFASRMRELDRNDGVRVAPDCGHYGPQCRFRLFVPQAQ